MVAVDVAVVVREVVVVAVVAVGTVVAIGGGWWLVNDLSKTWLELGLICLYREDHRWNVIEVDRGAQGESGFRVSLSLFEVTFGQVIQASL